MNIGCWLERRAAQSPEKPALFEGVECVYDYAAFDCAARSIAGWLMEQGIGPGDRIAMFMENIPAYLLVQYGAWYAGAVVVPINAKLHGREAAWIIENSGAAVVFANGAKGADLQKVGMQAALIDVESKAFAPILAFAQPLLCALRQPDDLAWLFYTSGTTGQPKGVMITHRMLISMSLSYFADVDRVTEKDSALYAAPLSHGAGIYNMIHVLKGAAHIFPPSRGFEPVEIFDLAEQFGSIHMFAAPTMVKRMTQSAKATGRTGKGLRSVIYAGGPMYLADIIEAVNHFGDIFIQIYGQGECPMGITALSREDVSDRSHVDWRARLGSVGQAQSAVQVQIGNSAGQALPLGTTGEIMVRGDTVMPGYWQNPDASARVLLDGWLMTGDMGFMDAAGYVNMVDRSKDMIISGGSNIYPREVEEVLLTHASVSEVSVVGRPHPEWGEEVIAFIVPMLAGDMDISALDAHCLDHIARFKRPKHYVEIDSLPKNNYGKVLKTSLRQQLVNL
ncbi:MAG: AMP-binding protein [Planktotalea arctica]|uniref:AMP-binding protein n=1 Tax=Planktotalea arctica TaxID=1481893 RepID=UPI0032197362